ncbi:MAG: TMEM165/GDT1 family protein [Nitriliruptoraceae bacterium]
MITAFGLVFLAELGDKSMLMALAFATRFAAVPVFGGIAAAAVIATGGAALLGGVVGIALPTGVLTIVAGVLFLGFGMWMLREEDDDDINVDLGGRSVFVAATATFVLAEIGDKTMLATAALASTQNAWVTWAGAATGMAAASGLAIVAGSALGSRVRTDIMRRVAAVVFLLAGVLLIAEGV